MYEWGGGGWRQVLKWQSEKYSEVNDAFGDFFEYSIAPLSSSGQWAVAVAHGHPWCTSRWSGFDIDIIAPVHHAAPQRVLFHKNYGYSREADPVMEAKADGFELRLKIGMMDGITTRLGIYRYRTIGNVQRIQPVAMNGRDFVDEWLGSGLE